MYVPLNRKPSRLYIRQCYIESKYNESKSIDRPHYYLNFLFRSIFLNNGIDKPPPIQYR